MDKILISAMLKKHFGIDCNSSTINEKNLDNFINSISAHFLNKIIYHFQEDFPVLLLSGEKPVFEDNQESEVTINGR